MTVDPDIQAKRGRAAVVVDAMGGDNAPEAPVKAALLAAERHSVPCILVGARSQIISVLGDRGGPSELISIVDAPETVSMEEEAARAVRRKRDASIPVGLQLLKSGQGSAFLSAGNTGAVTAAAVLSLGRLPQISRPGIAIPIPVLSGKPALLIDAGAIVDPKPEYMWQHARLAAAYVESANQKSRPRVALLSNGEESGKGNALVRAAFDLLSSDDDLNFVGNIEARSIFDDLTDVIVTDGFTGNVLLKTAEGTARVLQDGLRRELTKRWYTTILAGLLRPAFRRGARSLDYREYGGAPLLGVDGLVYIAHGRSNTTALVNAIRSAFDAAERGTLDSLRQTLQRGNHTGATSRASTM